MLQKLIELCVQRRLAALVVTAGIAAYGVNAYLALPVEAYPDVSNVQVVVIAQLSGQAPEEIERQVTVPIERVLNGTPGTILMRSESLFGLSLVTLTSQKMPPMSAARSISITPSTRSRCSVRARRRRGCAC